MDTDICSFFCLSPLFLKELYEYQDRVYPLHQRWSIHTSRLTDTLARLTSSCKCARMMPSKWKIIHISDWLLIFHIYNIRWNIVVIYWNRLLHSRFSEKSLFTTFPNSCVVFYFSWFFSSYQLLKGER